MSETKRLLETAERRMMKNYAPAPIVLARGQGCEVWDTDGRRYLDLCAGISVCVLGHSHPEVGAAVTRQVNTLLHVSNLFHNPLQIELAERLAARSLGGRVFFCNSGAEANEAQLKLARRYMQVVRGEPARVEFVSMRGSFHGRTMGALSVTGQDKYRQGFGPLLQDVQFVPYGDRAALEAVVSDRTCAVILEPLQAEGGVVPPPEGYLAAVRQLCNARGALLLFDEVQTGFGRTGSFFAYQHHEGATPDVLATAKGIAGGLPMGAIIATDDVARGFEPGSHASTFGGNLVTCAAALATLDVIDRDELVARAARLGEILHEELVGLVRDLPTAAIAARGEGLLRGLQTAPGVDAGAVVARCRERGILLSVAGGDVIRFSPPLIVTEAHIQEGIAALRSVLHHSAKVNP